MEIWKIRKYFFKNLQTTKYKIVVKKKFFDLFWVGPILMGWLGKGKQKNILILA